MHSEPGLQHVRCSHFFKQQRLSVTHLHVFVHEWSTIDKPSIVCKSNNEKFSRVNDNNEIKLYYMEKYLSHIN